MVSGSLNTLQSRILKTARANQSAQRKLERVVLYLIEIKENKRVIEFLSEHLQRYFYVLHLQA